MRSPLRNLAAFVSIFLGLLTGAWLWLIPYLGIPAALAGLLFGILARKSEHQNFALAGTIFSMIAMFLVLVNLGTNLILQPGF